MDIGLSINASVFFNIIFSSKESNKPLPTFPYIIQERLRIHIYFPGYLFVFACTQYNSNG